MLNQDYSDKSENIMSFDEALNRYTSNDEKNGEWKYIVADSTDPSKRIYCHAYQAEYNGEQYIKTDYEVYKGKEKVLSTNDGRFDGRSSSFWKNLKQVMLQAGEFSGNFVRFSNNEDFKDWAKEMNARNAEKSNEQAAAAPSVDKNDYANDAQLEQLRKMILEMQQEQQRLNQQINEQKSEETQQNADTAQEQPSTVSININEVKPEHSALLPIISTKVVKHEQRIEELKDRRAAHEDKIADYQGRAEKLTAKAERLTANSQMLAELLTRYKMPAAVVNSVRALIHANEVQAANIRNNKLPKLESKIGVRMTKIESIDKRINLRQCKINRYASLDNVIKSFAHADRKMFSASLDELHNNTIKMLNAKIDVKTDNIVKLTELYKQFPVRAAAADVPLRLTRQKISRQKLIHKRNKLMGVIIPYASQPEQVQDNVMKQAEEIITNAAKQENITPAEVSENVVLSAVPLLPEHSIVVPDTRQEEMDRLLPEIATVMDMPVSQLESKPRDLRDILILDYTNHFESTPEEIQESLARLINPDVRTEEAIDKRLEARNGLVSAELTNGETVHFQLNEQITAQRALEVIANAERPFIALREIGIRVDELQAASFEQSDKCGYSITANFNDRTANLYEINGGNGGISEENRTDSNVSFTHLDLNDFRNNPLKTTEELVEGNANMIDGIINNEPPKKDEPKQEQPKEEKPQGFTFSLAQLKRNAKRISQQKQEQPKDERKPPDHGAL